MDLESQEVYDDLGELPIKWFRITINEIYWFEMEVNSTPLHCKWLDHIAIDIDDFCLQLSVHHIKELKYFKPK